MEDTKEQGKINEARYLVLIPLMITVVCMWLDIWTSWCGGVYTTQNVEVTSGELIGTFCLQGESEETVLVYKNIQNANWIENVTSIIRCGMGYLFPSLLSIVIAMIWQQVSLKDKPYGVEKSKIGISVTATVLYSTVFLTCLIKYNIWTALIIVGVSVVYVVYVYKYCIDEHIKPKKKSEMTSDELLLVHLNKNEEGVNENENN